MANDEIKTELGTTTREEMDAALRNARPSPSGHGLTMEVSWATRQALRDAGLLTYGFTLLTKKGQERRRAITKRTLAD